MAVPQKQFVRKFGRWIVSFLITILLCLGVYWGTQTLFRITTIEIASSAITVAVDESRIPKNLLFFPAGRIAAQIKEGNPLLSDIRFEKKFPHTLVIVPIVREPVARLIAADRTVLVDPEGVVTGDDDGTHEVLARISIPLVGVRIGVRLKDPKVLAAVGFLVETRGLCAVSEITIYEARYMQATCDALRVFFTQDKPVAQTVATLQTLILGFRIKGTLPSVVDLRFDKPVVRF